MRFLIKSDADSDERVQEIVGADGCGGTVLGIEVQKINESLWTGHRSQQIERRFPEQRGANP